ncbi:hypothetical protein SGPA1_12050 [Streptomyces misionensis JCM 4497]
MRQDLQPGQHREHPPCARARQAHHRAVLDLPAQPRRGQQPVRPRPLPRPLFRLLVPHQRPGLEHADGPAAHHRLAHPGRGRVLPGRRPRHRSAGRLAARHHGRQDGHRGRHGRQLTADLLPRPTGPRDPRLPDPLVRQTRLQQLHRRSADLVHRADHPLGRAVHDLRRAVHPYGEIRDDRTAPGGTRPHRPRQGHVPAVRLLPLRLARLADPDRHHLRHRPRLPARRRHHHRVHLRPAGPRPTRRAVRVLQRPAAAARRDAVRRHHDPALQHRRRRRVRLHRPARAAVLGGDIHEHTSPLRAGPARQLQDRGRRRTGRGRTLLRPGTGPDPRHRGRVRLRQVGDEPDHPRSAQPHVHHRRGRDPAGRAGAHHRARVGAGEAARQQGRHDLPGPAHRALPLLHRRPADRRAVHEAQRRLQEGRLGTRRGDAGQGRHPQPPAAGEGLPAPVLRRHAPARDDRHGPGLRPRPAHRRRADHGARRDRAGADPRSAEGPATGVRIGHHLHHPRLGGDRRHGRRHHGDVRGRRGRTGHHRRGAALAPAPVHLGPAELHAAPGLRPGRAAVPDPGHPALTAQPAERLPLPSTLHLPGPGGGRRPLYDRTPADRLRPRVGVPSERRPEADRLHRGDQAPSGLGGHCHERGPGPPGPARARR